MSTDRSRLSRKLEKQTEKKFILSVIGIIVILFCLVKFGIPLLINATLLIGNAKDSQDNSEKSNTLSFVSPPLLNPLPNATNSAELTISGTAQTDEIITLYVNDLVVNKTETNKDNTYTFDKITLLKGENVIKAKARKKKNDKESNFSNAITVSFANDKPKLDISSPQDNQTFLKDSNSANISGKTDPGVKITVNNFWAIVNDDGTFLYTLPLQNGDNKINIVATDQAGNKTEVEKKVTYNP